jgi:hypothetical protein
LPLSEDTAAGKAANGEGAGVLTFGRGRRKQRSEPEATTEPA